MPEKPVRIYNYGGGVQSNAVMVLQAQGKIEPFDYFIFANVGNDSENPATLEYINRYARPYMEKHGIRLVEVQKTTRKRAETLLQYIYRTHRSMVIPVFSGNGSPPGTRACTYDFKIVPINQHIKKIGYTHCITGLGISLDEYTRVKGEFWKDTIGKKKLGFWQKMEHPLIDLKINRNTCHRIISKAGLPTPPKSSCYFCPFTKRNEWLRMRAYNPALFRRAVLVEQYINLKLADLKRGQVYIHPDLKPLKQAVGLQYHLPFPDWGQGECDSGACFT